MKEWNKASQIFGLKTKKQAQIFINLVKNEECMNEPATNILVAFKFAGLSADETNLIISQNCL